MRNMKGITLIELMIVIMIVSILAGVGYPSYKNHMAKAHRANAAAVMNSIANKEAQYYLDAKQYSADPSTSGLNIKAPSDQGWTCSATSCVNQHFTLTITTGTNPPSFKIDAVPVSTGSNAGMASFSLDDAGAKMMTPYGQSTEVSGWPN